MPRIRLSADLRLLAFRTLSLGFLMFHALRYLGDIVQGLPAAALFILAVIAAVALEGLRLRFIPAAAVFAGILAAGRALVFLLIGLYRSDFLYFRFDSSFLPMLPASGLVWLFTFLARRYRSFVPWECGVNTALFAALFWSQARFDISLYPHPGFLALAALVFILLQIAVLVETAPQRPSGRPGRGYRRLGWVLLPVLLLFMLFMFNWYNREAVSAGGGLIKPTFFRFDFSRYIRLESEISLDDDLVMLVRKEGGGNTAMLRRFVLSGYRDGEGFFFEAEPGSRGFRTAVPDSPVSLPDPGYAGRDEVLQEYYIVNFDPSSLISINYPVSVTPMVNWDESSFLRIYRVTSRAAGFLPFELSESPDPSSVMENELYEYYTRYGGDAEVRELALDVTASLDNYYERVVAIEAYLLDNYYYSLKPGVAADGRQLHHFLFESKKGYCSYFAFAMALMARSVGIPARVSVGFFTDPSSEIFNYYPVRADMAHAWVEVFFPDYGWIDFDPTSTVIAPGEEYTFDSMDMQEVSSLIEEILKNRYQLREEDEAVEEEIDGRTPWLQRTAAGLRRLASRWYLVLPGIYLAICLLLRVIHILRVLTARGPAAKTKGLYRRAVFALRGMGRGRGGRETWSEYAGRLDAVYGTRLTALTDIYLKALFAENFDSADLQRAMESFRDARTSIRRSFSVFRRAAGFFNPFGFRGGGT